MSEPTKEEKSEVKEEQSGANPNNEPKTEEKESISTIDDEYEKYANLDRDDRDSDDDVIMKDSKDSEKKKKKSSVEKKGEEDDEDELSDSDDDVYVGYYYNSRTYEKSDSGFTGLSNQGATCYLNSLVQTMFMTPEIRHKIFEWKYEKEKHGSPERSIPLQLQRLFSKLQLTKKRAVSTKKLTKSFGWDRSQSFVQHDVNELCRVLFDALDKTFAPNLYKRTVELKKCKDEKEVKLVHEKYDKLIAENKETFISSLFRGTMIDYVLAKDIKDKDGKEIGRKRLDQFLDVNLVVRGKKNIKESFAEFIKPEILGGENKWHCEQLDKKVDAIKGLKFIKFPPFLTLNLKRFDYNPISWTREKLGHKFIFPDVLDVGSYISKDDKFKVNQTLGTKYELYSLLIHAGSARAGHYYAYIKDFESGKWVGFNDQTVAHIKKKDVERMYGKDSDARSRTSTNAYMLFYRNLSLKKPKKIEDKAVPEIFRKKIMEKNKIVEIRAKRVEESKNMIVVRFYDLRHNYLTQRRVKKTITIKELMVLLHDRLCRKFKIKFNPEKIPLDCLRLREWSYRQKGRSYTGRENKTLEECNFSRIETCMVETKPKGTEWKKEIVYIYLYITPLFPGTEEYGNYSRIKVKTSYSLSDLRSHIARMFKRSVEDEEQSKKCDKDHIAIFELSRSKNKILVYKTEDNEKNIEELGIEDHSDLFVELFVDKPIGDRILYEENFTYDLRYNLIGSGKYNQRIKFGRNLTLKDLKKAIAKKIDMDVNEFRMLNEYYNKSVFKNMNERLQTTMLYNNSKLHLEKGKPLGDDEAYVKIYKFTPIEEIERLEKENEEKEKAKEKEENEEKEKEGEGEKGKGGNNGIEGDKPKEKGDDSEKEPMSIGKAKEVIGNVVLAYSKRKRKEREAKEKIEKQKGVEKKEEGEEEKKENVDKKKGQKRVPTKLKEVNEEIEQSTKDKDVSVSQKGPMLKVKMSDFKMAKSDETAKSVPTTNSSTGRALMICTENVDKVTYPGQPGAPRPGAVEDDKEMSPKEKEKMELRTKVMREDKPKSYSAWEYHDRLKKQYKYLFKVIVSNKMSVIELKEKIASKLKKRKIKPNQIRVRATKYFRLLHILKTQKMKLSEIHPRILEDKKVAVQFLEKEEMMDVDDSLLRVKRWNSADWTFGEEKIIFHNKNKMTNVKETVCRDLKLKAEDIFVFIVPQDMDLKKRSVAMLNWEKEDFQRRVFDDCLILYKLKDDKEKYEIEMLKNLFKNEDPTKQSGYEKEESLVIKTEFDEKYEGEEDDEEEMKKKAVELKKKREQEENEKRKRKRDNDDKGKDDDDGKKERRKE